MKTTSQSHYTFKDAANIFLYAILMPQIVGILFIFLIMALSTLFGSTYEIAMENVVTKMFTLFLAQIGFIIVFFTYQSFQKIDWVKATKIKNKISIKQIILLIIIAGASLFLFSPLINLVDHLISLTGYSASSSLPINLKTVGGFIVGLVALTILPAIFEEFIFRGVLYQGFENKFGYKKAIVFSALLFALMHTSIQQTVYQIVIGVMLAYAFYITGSLLASIILHFFNNFIIIMLNIFVSETTTPTEPVFTSLSDYTEVLLFTVIGAYIVWLLFELLKKFSKKQVNAEQSDVLMKDNFAENLPYDNSSLETGAMLESDLSPKTLENTLQMTKQSIKYRPSFLLAVGIAMGVLFWLIDFISYLP